MLRELALATFIGVVALFALGLTIFLVKWLTFPAKIAEEARSKISDDDTEKEKAEKSRRHSVVGRLVDLYCLELADKAPAPIRAGLELPPVDWLNERLANLGEVWTIFNVMGSSYQTFEVVAGSWHYGGRKVGSPAAVKWAAFFDALGLLWSIGRDHFDGNGRTPDFYLPELNLWFAVASSVENANLQGYRDVARNTDKCLILAEGPPNADRENLLLIKPADDEPISRWTWREDRRDKGIFWLAKFDGSAAICLGGSGTPTDHDREPIVGRVTELAFKKAAEQPTPFEKLRT